MDWYELTNRYHELSIVKDGKLSSLVYDWQRELAAICRLEADVNNGTYLQFIENWDSETYDYALRCLRRIHAKKMARIIEECQKLVLKHTDSALPNSRRFKGLLSNPVIHLDGSIDTPAPSPLPDKVIKQIYDLSYRFMEYPDNIAALGLAYYQPLADEST